MPYVETAGQAGDQGVGHTVHLAHPGRVIGDVVAFLNRHAPATTG